MGRTEQKGSSVSRDAPAAAVDSGPFATPEQARNAKADALNLLRAITPFNLPRAADYVRRNPPSADAIAMLGFLAYQVLTSAHRSFIARLPRPKSLREQMRRLDIHSYAEARRKVPELCDKHGKEKITQAISKAKRK